MNSDESFYKMEENLVNNKFHVSKNTLKDILISPNNDDVIIPISATFDKAVLHIGIGKLHCISIEKIGVKGEKELKTSVKYATKGFRNDYYKRSNKSLDITESSEDGKKNVVEGGEKFKKDMPGYKVNENQMAKFVDTLFCTAPTESRTSVKKIPFTSSLKQNESGNDLVATSSAGDFTEKFYTSNVKNDVEQTSVPSPGFESKAMAEPDMKTDGRMFCEKRLETERTIPIEAIVEEYQNEMLENASDKDSRAYQPNDIGPLTDPELDFSLTDDMHTYLDEIYVVPKRDFQEFLGYFSDSKEEEGKDTELHNLISDSGQDISVAEIDKGCAIPNDDMLVDNLDKERDDLMSSSCVDIEAVDELSESDELEGNLDKETDNKNIDIEVLSFKVLDEVGITKVVNGISDTSVNTALSYTDDNMFGILDLYINSELHWDYSKIPVSEQCDQKTDYGYKFFSFSPFFE